MKRSQSAMIMRRLLFAPCVAAIALGAMVCAEGCGQRIEYRARPGFTTSEDLPDEVVLDDGTIIRYVPLTEFLARKRARERGESYRSPEDIAAASKGANDEAIAGPTFSPWEELEDGTVRMQARMPEQVVANTMRAFREERYAELWDQMVTPRVRQRAASEVVAGNGDGAWDQAGNQSRNQAGDGNGGAGPGRASDLARARFAAWCAKHREEVMKLLNRMSFGFSSNALIMRKSGPNSLSIELTPQLASDFRFRVVEIEFDQSSDVTDAARVTLSGIR